MTDLEITKRCAEKMGYKFITEVSFPDSPDIRRVGATTETGMNILYDPLHDDAQAMALVKKFALQIDPDGIERQKWMVGAWVTEKITWQYAESEDLNRAICLCVAKLPD